MSPIMIGVVYSNLTSRLDAARDNENPLYPLPVEFLEMAVRVTGMVNESREVP